MALVAGICQDRDLNTLCRIYAMPSWMVHGTRRVCTINLCPRNRSTCAFAPFAQQAVRRRRSILKTGKEERSSSRIARRIVHIQRASYNFFNITNNNHNGKTPHTYTQPLYTLHFMCACPVCTFPKVLSVCVHVVYTGAYQSKLCTLMNSQSKRVFQ